MSAVGDRLARLDREAIRAALDERGWATTGPVLDDAECWSLIALFAGQAPFRSRVEMARYRFDLGEYKYFGLPLPPRVVALRRSLYPPLVSVSNDWMERLGSRERFPEDLDGLAALCARHGQTRPTPLLLRYGAGGYNEEANLPARFAQAMSRQKDRYDKGVEKLIQEGIRQGVFREAPPRLVVYALLGMVNWLYKWCDPAGPLGAEEIARAYLDFIERGLLAPKAFQEPQLRRRLLRLRREMDALSQLLASHSAP